MQNQNAVVEESFADLDGLDFLDELEDMVNEEILVSHQEVIADDETDLLVSVVNEAESEEEMAEIYAAQEPQIVETVEMTSVDGGEVVIMSPAESVELAEPVVAKVRKTKATNPADRIISKLGTAAIDFTTLTPDCAALDETAQLEQFATTVNSMALYVSDKAVNLFTYLQTGAGLNGVTARGFEVLLRDGQLVGGDTGNIVQNLLSKPYSLGTARSQSNQLLQLFTDLKIGTRTGRGVVVTNPDSVILERVKTILGK